MPLLYPQAASANAISNASSLEWHPVQITSVSKQQPQSPDSASETPQWLKSLLQQPSLKLAARKLIENAGFQYTKSDSDNCSASSSASTSSSSSSSPPTSASFASSPLPPMVYVHQREIALVSPSIATDVKLIGSADATTCVILLLECAATGRVCITHLDGASDGQIHGVFREEDERHSQKQLPASKLECGSIKDALAQFTPQDVSQGIELHLVGGFQTHQTTQEIPTAADTEEAAAASENTTAASTRKEHELDDDEASEEAEEELDQTDGLRQVKQVLTFLHTASTSGKFDIRLQTLCVGPLNTQWNATDVQAPVSSSSPSASSIATSTSSPVSFSYPRPFLTSVFFHVPSRSLVGALPFQREDRGPAMVLRCIRGGVGPRSLSRVYDEANDEYCIAAYAYPPLSPAGLRSLLALDDTTFVHNCSTSPLVEPPNFIPDMRDSYTFLMHNPYWQRTFPNLARPSRFKRNINQNVNQPNGWTQISAL